MVDELHDSHERMCAAARRLTDADVREPSRLPAWTRGMLLAHLRFGGEAQLLGINAAAEGQTVDMYPGGEEQREGEIESGRNLSAVELVETLTDLCRRMESTLRELPPAAWNVPVNSRRGPIPVRVVVAQRWLDVEVHHVDLGIGYEARDWPAALIDLFLPQMFEVLPILRTRPDADRSIIGSWQFDRTDGDGTWLVRADHDETMPDNDAVDAECTLSGSGRALLALLLGREPCESVAVSGDQALAGQLKRAFPGP
jgi:maleylpyruvate isomerase